MSEQPTKQMAIWKILLVVGIAAVVIYIVGESFRTDTHDPSHVAHVLDRVQAQSPPRSEQGKQLQTSLSPTMQAQQGVQTRVLKTYYERRAYPGAPPLIPHEVDPEIARTMNCNVCHANGGYTPKFNAYVPVTPHPQYQNCMQCHVEAKTDTKFVTTNWKSVNPPSVHRPALPGSPPPIPHTLQLRENCLACHAGPSAVAEVRTSHPERVNCRQCHVPRTTDDIFNRAVSFKRGD